MLLRLFFFVVLFGYGAAETRAEFWKNLNGGNCEEGSVYRRDGDLCCKPTVCGPGYYLLRCLEDGEREMCSKCPEGTVQPSNISSLDYPDVGCFVPEPLCPMKDYRPDRNIQHAENFPLKCACDETKCYYDDGDGMICQLKDGTCGVNRQMTGKGGACEECPWYAEKQFEGCHRCAVNLTILETGSPPTPEQERDFMCDKMAKKAAATIYEESETVIAEVRKIKKQINASIKKVREERKREIKAVNKARKRCSEGEDVFFRRKSNSNKNPGFFFFV